MTPRRSAGKRAAALAAAGVLALGWFLWLRPTTLGGQQSYVIVQGSSMEPTYDDGDLVVVREEDQYASGDIVAFRAGGEFQDPTRIIHRIVGDAGDGRFITQGDNRDRIDPWAPAPEDIIGRAVLHVPRLGSVASDAGRPEVLGALGAFFVLLGRRVRRRRRMTLFPNQPPTPPSGAAPVRQPRLAPAPPRWLRHTEPRWAFAGLVACALLALPILGATWSALRASDTTVRADSLGQVDLGIELDYRFLGEPSAVYPTGTVGTTRDAAGLVVPAEPLFGKLLHRLEVVLGFRAAAEGASDVAARFGADAVVEMPEGWSTKVGSFAPTTFTEPTTEVLAVDLADVARRVQDVTTLTGVGGQEYTLKITPWVQLDGSAAGDEVREEVGAELAYVFSGGVIEASPADDADLGREISREVRDRARYGLGPIDLSMPTARAVLSGVALVLLAAAGWFASVLFGGVGLGEPARIAARYRNQLVDVSAATGPPGPVVLVGGIDELARLAKVEQSVILHEDLGDGGHRYRVFLGAVTYEFESAPEHGGRAAAPMPGDAAREP